MDLAGETLHSIHLRERGPGRDCMLEPISEGAGDFLALTWPYLARIGWDSKVRWLSRDNHHHDFAVADGGEIYTLSARSGFLRHDGRRLPILDHAIVRLDSTGSLEEEVVLSRLFRGHVSEERLERMEELRDKGSLMNDEHRWLRDVLHPNTVEILRTNLGVGSEGDLLICLREPHLIAIVDFETRRLVWSWGEGVLDRPHQPTVLENGNLLVFDNGFERGYSRLVELDPRTERIMWQYVADPPERFFSPVRGGLQPLANGNILVTESTKGHVFEITRNGDVVWEFWNPEFTHAGHRKQIYRMIRLDRDLVERLRVAETRGSPR